MKRRRKIAFSTKIILLLSVAFILLDLGLGAFLVVRSINRMSDFMQGKMIESACTAANLVNGDEIASLTPEDTYENNEAYKRNYDTLHAFKTSAVDTNAGLAYIYALVKVDDKIVFSIDPSDDPAVFMKEETIVTDALLGAFKGTAGFDTVSYVDRWGDLYSAYAPIFGSDGTVIAVIGADVWANWYKGEITSNSIAIGIITLSTAIVCIAVSILVARSVSKRYTKLSTEMDELSDSVASLIKDIDDPEFTNRKRENKGDGEGDQLLKLRGKLSITTQDLKDYVEYARKQAFQDSLSGLMNRASYVKRVNAIKEAIDKKQKIDFGIIILDVDSIKEINDKYGHEVGDKVIDVAGHSVLEVFEKENSFRIGGDELVIITSDIREESISLKLNMFNKIYKSKVHEAKLKFNPTVSYGYSIYNGSKIKDKQYSDIFREADIMMSKMKALHHLKE